MVWTVDRPSVRYCPLCGDPLGERERDCGTHPHCGACDLTVYRTPEPMGRATVVDGDSLLLVEHRYGPDAGTWGLAGGRPEYDEPARVGAARELAEETGLVVAPEDLTLVGDGFVDLAEGGLLVSLNYAAPREAATGTVEADDDAADARFWPREEIRENPPPARASGREQLIEMLDLFDSGD